MDTFKSFATAIYEVNDQSFDDIALDIFRYQAKHNLLYAEFLARLRIDTGKIDSVNAIPFLPVSFFKTHTIQTANWIPQSVFLSSGTTGSNQSKHLVPDVAFYLNNARHVFEFFFGSVKDFHFLALLPSYLEREGSSLIAMIRHFIDESNSELSGFFLQDYDRLLTQLQAARESGRKTILWGVSFALLDLADRGGLDLHDCLVFETGGMKGRRKEITRQEFHAVLRERFSNPAIYSEYGMTELFSQAYTSGGFPFRCPPQMKVVGRDMSDPMQKNIYQETCGINVIDLANWQTISFIETEDIGKVYRDGTFEILGRMDNSEIRGCNLMV